MPTGLPDWTTGVDILAQTIESLAVDIAAQTIGDIAVDIAAQTIGNIDINLKASDITLNINISSQTANLNVNLAASAISITVVATNLSIDIDAQSVGVSNQAEWQSQAIKWVTIKSGSRAVANITDTEVIDYTVTAGKTFFIYAMTCSLLTAVAPTFQVSMTLYTNTIIRLDVGSGTSNPQLIIPVPIRAAAGTKIEVNLWHSQGASQNFYATVLGYEA